MEKSHKHTNAYRYLDKHWEEMQNLRLPNIETILKQEEIQYDRKKLQRWLHAKNYKVKNKLKFCTKSMATASVAGDFFDRDEELKEVESPLSSTKLTYLSNWSAFKAFKPVVLNGQAFAATQLGPGMTTEMTKFDLFQSPTKQLGDLAIESSESFQGSQGSQQGTPCSKENNESTQLHDLKKSLTPDEGWRQIEEMVRVGSFKQIKQIPPSYNLYMSLLVQGMQIEKPNSQFVSALAISYNWLINNEYEILPAIADAYRAFFDKLRISKTHTLEEKRFVFQLCRQLRASVEWIKKVQDPQLMLGEAPLVKGCITQVRKVLENHKFYCQELFDFIDYFVKNSKIVAKHVDGFFECLKQEKVILDLKFKEAFYRYCQLENSYGKYNITVAGAQILQVLTQNIGCSQFINCTELILETRNSEIVKELVKQRRTGENYEELKLNFSTLLAKQLQQKEISRQKEELKQQEKQRLLGNKTKEEEQKRIAAELEQQILQQLEEQKQNAEEEKRLYQEQLTTSLRHQFDLFVDKNQFREETLAQVLSFVDDLQKIAGNIKKQLKAEQLVTLGLLLLSQKHTTLIQLATGFGKSMLLGVLADYLNKTAGNKVIVVVPTSFLHLYQESNYCPTASKIPEDINDPSANQVFYCTYDQFLQLDPNLLSRVIVLIDEFHELFFNQPIAVANGRLISVVSQLTTAARIIGVSATFRGDTGIKKIKTILTDSNFLTSPGCFQEKRLELEVFGELSTIAITQKAILLAKEKSQQMPVVVFCANIIACQEWKEIFLDANIFVENETENEALKNARNEAGNKAGDLVALLQNFSQLSKGIVLTTSKDCTGADFVFAVPQAFVIHTALPSTWLQLQQDFGRGVRGYQELPVLGAIFTEGPQTNLWQIEQKLTFSDRFAKLFPLDYGVSHSLLVACSVSNATKPAITFETAVSMLNEGKSATEIYKVLNTVKRFREFLPKEAPKAEFKVPTIQLGKRKVPEKIRTNTLENYLAPRSTSSSFMSKAIKEADEVIQLQQQTMNDFPQAQQENYEHSTFENSVNVTTHQKQVSEQVVFKHDALQAIAVTKAKEVLAGIKINEECKSEDSEEPIKRCDKNQESADVQVGQSKTSSVILFGEKQNHEQKPDPSESLSQFSSDGNLASESLETGINKRELKQWEKGSVANSSRTNQSKRSIGSKHGIHKKKQCPHCQYEGQTCDLKKHIQRKHKNL